MNRSRDSHQASGATPLQRQDFIPPSPQSADQGEDIDKVSSKRRVLRYRGLSGRNARRVPTAQKIRTFFRFFHWTMRWGGWLVVLPLFFLACRYVVGHFLNDTYFGLRHIEFAQTYDMSQEEFLLAGGLRTGQNLLQMDLQQVVRQLQKHPQIQWVRLQRKFPHTLRVELKTPQPAAVVELDQFYLMSATGILYKIASVQQKNSELLKIGGIRKGEYMAHPRSYQRIFRHALAIRTVYQEKGLSSYAKLREIRIDRVIGYVLFTERTTIYVGLDRLPERLQALHKLFKLFGPKGLGQIQTIYLNLEHHLHRAVIKPYRKNAQQTAPSPKIAAVR